MKNRIYKSLFLGISSAVVASASYALITPESKVRSADINAFTNNAFLIGTNNPFNDQFAFNFDELGESSDFRSIEHIIERGENLSTIFSKLHLNKSDLHQIIHANEAGREFAMISSGKTLQVKTTHSGELTEISYQKSPIETVKAVRENDSFNVEISSKAIETTTVSTVGTIHNSLFYDGKRAGLSDKLILQLADIFAFDIDFALDIKENDTFSVVYEKHIAEGEEVGSGNILAAEFNNHGKVHRAVRFQDNSGSAQYYRPNGDGLRKAFVRTPVDFIRISSPFNLKRKHPILNRIRAHKGVDYAAKTGTPVKVTGDGKIQFLGRQNGYGRVIIVQHDDNRYSTLYAHLSAFNNRFKQGGIVKQGDIIGYVGQSGLASGPHLHYEFRVNGVHRDPLSVALPNSMPISPSLQGKFKADTKSLIAQLDQARDSLLAQK